MKKLFSQAGFTMIELLVVIAVIGVLAVAVVSSINPIEQINKGRDTRTRSDAAQFINAVDRYYASLEVYPWNVAIGEVPLAEGEEDPASAFPGTTNCTTLYPGGEVTSFCQLDENATWMDELSRTGEVKESFLTRIKEQTTYALYGYKALGAQESLYTCFAPSSGAFQREAVKNCFDHKDNYPDAMQAIVCPATEAYTASQDYADELICLP